MYRLPINLDTKLMLNGIGIQLIEYLNEIYFNFDRFRRSTSDECEKNAELTMILTIDITI